MYSREEKKPDGKIDITTRTLYSTMSSRSPCRPTSTTSCICCSLSTTLLARNRTRIILLIVLLFLWGILRLEGKGGERGKNDEGWESIEPESRVGEAARF